MRIHLVEPYHSHAMTKPVEAIASFLDRLQVPYTVGAEPDYDADLNYHMPWHTAVKPPLGPNPRAKHVICYTHTNPGAEGRLQQACAHADLVVCMSFEGRRELLELGVSPEKLWVVQMGAMPVLVKPIRIGMVGAEQPNGRKRSHLLLDLAWQMPEVLRHSFEFDIIGTGWERVVDELRSAGVRVTHRAGIGDLELAAAYRQMDYVLVTGYREGGPLPALEATACGVPVIMPPYGMYRELAIPSNMIYRSDEELRSILRDIARPVQQRVELASLYSWENWAEEHVCLFEQMLGVQFENPGGVERPQRYARLLDIAEEVKPRTIVEIGTWRGDRAMQLIQTALKYHQPEDIGYIGFDLFEGATPGKIRAELSKTPPSSNVVQRRLAASGVRVSLAPGDTKDTLPRFAKGITADLIFVDGGHSWDTIAADWENLQPMIGPETVVVFDDYYTDGPDGFGCQRLLGELDRDVWEVSHLMPIDTFSNGLIIHMVTVKRRSVSHDAPELPPMPGMVTKGRTWMVFNGRQMVELDPQEVTE